MIKTVAVGAWASALALGAGYATATMQSGSPTVVEVAPGGHHGLEYRRPPPITVPMITDGRLRGYVVTRVVYTANATELATFPIDPEPFVIDESFRRVYTDGRVEFDQLSRYNLDDITATVRANVNERLGTDLIQDVLLEDLNYIDKASMDKGELPSETASADGHAPDKGHGGHN